MVGLSSSTAMSSSRSLSCDAGCLARAYKAQVSAVDEVSFPANICLLSVSPLSTGPEEHAAKNAYESGDLGQDLVIAEFLIGSQVGRHVCPDCLAQRSVLQSARIVCA